MRLGDSGAAPWARKHLLVWIIAALAFLCAAHGVMADDAQRRDAPALSFDLGHGASSAEAPSASAVPEAQDSAKAEETPASSLAPESTTASSGGAQPAQHAASGASSSHASHAPQATHASASAAPHASANESGTALHAASGSETPEATHSAPPNAAPTQSISYPPVDIPKAPSTSVPFNIMSAPASLGKPNATVSSNVTLPAPAQTASWSGPLPALISQMYRGSNQSLENLPKLHWNLANSSLSRDQKQNICASQTHFCATAGCEDDSDNVVHNFCDLDKGMATMCACAKSASRLLQYQWPVQSQDCLIRLQTCSDMCNNQRATPFQQRSTCSQACADQIGSSCGKPEQYGVSYMVSKPGALPEYAIKSQADAQKNGAAHMRPEMLAVLSSAALVALVLLS
ncbi:hypothetical protein MSPP1_001001 [Malassezia sp. CBS 17886]|nr:hypothetical protein MSPP1_001001 [Malassezia sp. CBS 17886]